MVTITESAQEYLTELLEKQDCEGISVRIFILDAGTPKAETCISFCRPGEEKEDDELKQYCAHHHHRYILHLLLICENAALE